MARDRYLTAQQQRQLQKQAFFEEMGGHVDKFYGTIWEKAKQLGGATKEGFEGAVQELTQDSRLPNWMMAAGYLPHVVDYLVRKSEGQAQPGAAGQAAGQAAGAAAAAASQFAPQVQQATRGEELAAMQSLPAQQPQAQPQGGRQDPQSLPQAGRQEEVQSMMSMPVGASRRSPRRPKRGRRPASKLQRLAEFWDERIPGQKDPTLDDLMTPAVVRAITGAIAAYPGKVDERTLGAALRLLLQSRRIPQGIKRFGAAVILQWLKRKGLLKGARLTPEAIIHKYASRRRR